MENLIESMKQNDTTFTLHHALIILPLIFGLIKGSKIALSVSLLFHLQCLKLMKNADPDRT